MGAQALGTTIRGAGSFITNVGNTYAQLTGDFDYNNAATKIGQELATLAQSKDGYGIDVQKNRIMQAVAQSETADFFDKFKIIGKAVVNNPIGFFDVAGTETIEEIPSLLAQLGVAFMTGGAGTVALNSGRLIQGTISLVDSFTEVFGSAGKET